MYPTIWTSFAWETNPSSIGNTCFLSFSCNKFGLKFLEGKRYKCKTANPNFVTNNSFGSMEIVTKMNRRIHHLAKTKNPTVNSVHFAFNS